MSIITNKLRTENAKKFISDFQDNEYFLFASSLNNVGTLTNNSDFSAKEFLEKTLFGKKILPTDVFPAIQIYRWQKNDVYTQYDDKADLSSKQFYIVVYPQDQGTGDYRIFKCLFNNYGSESLHAPNYGDNVPDQIYRTPDDGYVWKYMFSITNSDFERYNVLGFIPITNALVDTQGNKSIDQIFVENILENVGYEVIHGTIVESQPTVFQIVLSATNLDEIESFYSGQSIYITNPANGEAKLYEIVSYNFNVNTNLAIATLKNDDENINFIQVGFSFSITPRIEIKGDGNGAKAYPIIENGQITRIEIYKSGQGYNNATAIVVDPLFGFNPDEDGSIDKRAILRPIISPAFGHGTDVVAELLSRHVIVYSGFSFVDNSVFPVSNSFSKIGLVKNPEFVSGIPSRFDNRIKLTLNVNPLSVGDVVLQINNNAANTIYDLNETFFEATVQQTSNNNIWLADYMGPFLNQDNQSTSLNPDEFIQTPQGQLISISTDEFTQQKLVEQSQYIQRTGEVLYMSEFSPIERTDQSNEQFKLILEF
jgi:hypothetical protein